MPLGMPDKRKVYPELAVEQKKEGNTEILPANTTG
jgi:hypothetical protein